MIMKDNNTMKGNISEEMMKSEEDDLSDDLSGSLLEQMMIRQFLTL